MNCKRENHAVAAPPAAVSGRRGTVLSRSGLSWRNKVKGIWETASTMVLQSLQCCGITQRQQMKFHSLQQPAPAVLEKPTLLQSDDELKVTEDGQM